MQKKKHPSIRRFLRLLAVDLLVLLLLQGMVRLWQHQQKKNQAVPVLSDAISVDLPILMYHSIRNGPETDYSITPETLESDFRYLKNAGYHSVSPEDLLRFVKDGLPLPEHPILLTFDDGFYNNLAYALPLLEKYDFCATVNIVGEFTQKLAPADSHIPAYSYLTAEDCRALLASHRMTLGNHTTNFHHRNTRKGCAIQKGESENAYHAILYKDLFQLQEYLAEQFQTEPIVFAYPYGFECPESIPVLHELGFLITLTCREFHNTITQGDMDSLYGLGRYNRAGNQSSEGFFQRIIND